MQDGESLTIQMFGGLVVDVGGKPLPALRSRKSGWLLALLALSAGREVRRDALANALWPESLPSDALTGLRQSLADLRKALGPEACRLRAPTTRTLRFDVTGATIDALEFDQDAARKDRNSLRRAVELVRGPLLDGCAEPWAIAEREARQQTYIHALETLAAQALADGAAAEAILLLRRGVQADVWNEEMQRSLMRILAKQGDYAEAFQVYAALRNSLFEAHHIAPQPETTALYQRLRETARRSAPPVPANPRPDVGAVGNIPLPLTSLIGRLEEARTIQAHLILDRLVSIVGTGGAGKTQLALHVARELQETYRDGVWFVDLSALTAADSLPQAVAAALGLRFERGNAGQDALTEALAGRQMLLLLDNCEHLAAACAELARRLLTHCPGLRLLTTSRQPLGLTGEVVIRLAGLALPMPGRATEAEMSDAARLFIERAQAARTEFDFSESGDAIADICRLLDGLPLAIELAAPLVESLTAPEIAARLRERLDLLRSDDPTRAPRHQTLQAVVEWSYALLAPAEQRLLRRVSVFAGGWMLDAAEHLGAGDGVEAWEITRLLARLVTKSLVMTQNQGAAMRYRLLETARQEITRRLEQAGEAAETRKRHADYYLRLAETAAPELTGSGQAEWLERLEMEQENFRAALQNSAAPACARLRLTCALGRFWQIRGYFHEGQTQTAAALNHADAACPAAYRAEALGWGSLFATYQGDAAGGKLAREALDWWNVTGDAGGKSRAWGCLGIAALNRGEYAAAQSAFSRSLAAAQEAQNASGIASACGYLGLVAASAGDTSIAEDFFQQSLRLRRQSGDLWGIAASLNNLGLLAKHREDWRKAKTLLEESLELRRRLRDRRSIAITLNLLGGVRCRQGEPAQARTLLAEGLRLCWQTGDLRNSAYALEAFAGLFQRREAPERAALLQGAAERLREQIGLPLSPADARAYTFEKAELRRELGEALYQTQWEIGAALTLEQAAALCLSEQPTEP